MAVYAIQAGEGGPIKIGVAVNVKNRLIKIQVDNAANCILLGTKDGSLKIERELHQRLAAHRVRGEWFQPNEDVLAVIRSEFSPAAKLKASRRFGEVAMATKEKRRKALMASTAEFAALPGVADTIRERRRRGCLLGGIKQIQREIARLEGRKSGSDASGPSVSAPNRLVDLLRQKLEKKRAEFDALPPYAVDIDTMRAAFASARRSAGGPVAGPAGRE